MLKLLSFFIFFISSNAFAQSAANPETGFASFVPLIIIFVIFYFLLIRPQHKKMKQHQEMLSELKVGNYVCTQSGIFGKIRAMDKKEKITDLEISDGVIIKILTASIDKTLDSKKINQINNISTKASKTKTSKKSVKSTAKK